MDRIRSQDLVPTIPETNNTIEGYAVKWNEPQLVSDNGVDYYYEQFEPTAFDEFLKSRSEVWALVEHDSKRRLGKRTAGTLELSKDDIGLRFVNTPPHTTIGNDVKEEIKTGLINGVSVRYKINPSKDIEKTVYKGRKLEIIKKAGVREISYTSTPQHKNTTVRLRSEEKIPMWKLKLLLLRNK